MPRESQQEKAARLVALDRAQVLGRQATVQGDHGTYTLTRRGTQWQCPCGSKRSRCSHVLAVEMVVAAQRTERNAMGDGADDLRDNEEYREFCRALNAQPTQEEQIPMSETQAAPQFQVRKAEKRQLKARLALMGPPGSGKTYSALGIGDGLRAGGKMVLVDTEHRTSEKFAQDFDFDVLVLDPETVPYNTYSPATYTAIIKHLQAQGYEVIIIDSLSHAWMGKDGALEQVDKRSKGGNSFTAWGDVTPMQREMVETILGYPGHVIVTMRTKIEHATGTDSRGKMTVEKLGTKPIQRDDVEYEFDIVGEFDQAHNMTVTKTRLKFLDRCVIASPGKKLGEDILADLDGGEPVPEVAPPAVAPAEAAPGPWALSTKQAEAIRERMALIGYDQAQVDAAIKVITTPEVRDELVAQLKKEYAAWKKQQPAATDAPGAPPPTQEAQPQETPAPSPQEAQAAAEPASGPDPLPDTETASQDTTAQPAPEPEPTPEAPPPAGEVDFDAAGGQPAQALNPPLDMREESAVELLERACAAVEDPKGVPLDMKILIGSNAVLRGALEKNFGIPQDQQDVLLVELGLEGWEELTSGGRYAILLWAQQKKAAG